MFPAYLILKKLDGLAKLIALEIYLFTEELPTGAISSMNRVLNLTVVPDAADSPVCAIAEVPVAVVLSIVIVPVLVPFPAIPVTKKVPLFPVVVALEIVIYLPTEIVGIKAHTLAFVEVIVVDLPENNIVVVPLVANPAV
jgi:hypothetical protein